MHNIEPIIYTRTRYVDYDLLVIPASLRCSDELSNIKKHIRHVLYDEDPSRPLAQRRWHVMRIHDKILVGIAGYETERTDVQQRPIRGYYGFFMPLSSAVLPSRESFYRLAESLITPYFDVKKLDWDRYYSTIDDALIIEDVEENSLVPFNFQFNTELSQIKFFDDKCDVKNIVIAAINAAKKHRNFEFIYGLTVKEHAISLPTMNVVCFGVPSSVEKIANSSNAKITSYESISHRSVSTVERSTIAMSTFDQKSSNSRKEPFIGYEYNERFSDTAKTHPTSPFSMKEKINISIECESKDKWKIEKFISRILEALKSLFPGIKCRAGEPSLGESKKTDILSSRPNMKKKEQITYGTGMSFRDDDSDKDDNTRIL